MPSVATQTMGIDHLQLSIILPFFKKLQEFRRVLALNVPYFVNPRIEVIVVMDDNTDERALMALLAQYQMVRWRVIVNDATHPWRPPCKAINVGLRHAGGRYVLICSPESAFIDDVPGQFLQVMQDSPGGIALGRVGFATFDSLADGRTLEQHFYQKTSPALLHRSFYGSVCGSKAAFEAVGGYDESFTDWGGDDDNLRVRLEMAGFALLWCPSVRLLHLSFEARHGTEQYNLEADRHKCSPQSVVANTKLDWGRDFSRQVQVQVQLQYSIGAPIDGMQPDPAANVLAGPVIQSHSRRQCSACGRLLYHQPATAGCTVCRVGTVQAVKPIARRSVARATQPKVACLMQLRNEALHLEGCLSHLREYVDGVVALDDGSTDNTVAILNQNSMIVVDCIKKASREPHAWNELENKQLLLKRARQLGFDWVLCCDADERYEIAFLARLRQIANAFSEGELGCVSVALREMWNTPMKYRIDGIWGTKTRARFFSLPDRIEFDLEQELHGQWYPDHIRRYARMLNADHNLYHLKSIAQEDRVKRRDFYKKLDPNNKFQTTGYDYLAEEGDSVQVEGITPGHEYDLNSLPQSLRSLCD
jgi:glycosyltransferase involved in cell wall biosynthesis